MLLVIFDEMVRIKKTSGGIQTTIDVVYVRELTYYQNCLCELIFSLSKVLTVSEFKDRVILFLNLAKEFDDNDKKFFEDLLGFSEVLLNCAKPRIVLRD